MSNFEDKSKERWTERRKSGYNWKKLLIMLIMLVALIVLMKRLDNASRVPNRPAAEVIDSTAVTIDPLPGNSTP